MPAARKTTPKARKPRAARKDGERKILLPDIREGVLHDKNGKPVDVIGAPIDSAPETPAADDETAEG